MLLLFGFRRLTESLQDKVIPAILFETEELVKGYDIDDMSPGVLKRAAEVMLEGAYRTVMVELLRRVRCC